MTVVAHATTWHVPCVHASTKVVVQRDTRKVRFLPGEPDSSCHHGSPPQSTMPETSERGMPMHCADARGDP